MCTCKQKSKKPAGTPGNYNYVFSCTKDDGTKIEIKVTAANDNEAKQLAELECEETKIANTVKTIISEEFEDTIKVLLNPDYSNEETLVVAFWGSCKWLSVPVSSLQEISKIGYGICDGRQYPMVKILLKELFVDLRNNLISEKSDIINSLEEINFPEFNEAIIIENDNSLTKELSGVQWVARFPGSNSINSLASPFKENVQKFYSALVAASATINISATLRPLERAFLMRTSFDIANGIISPSNAGSLANVNINWVHNTPQASIEAAKAMVSGYGIVYQPAYPTKHSEGTAIDMNITWKGILNIKKADETIKSISTTPRTNANLELQQVANSYDIYKLASDPPHWSDDGH
jgi:hypothetical protein